MTTGEGGQVTFSFKELFDKLERRFDELDRKFDNVAVLVADKASAESVNALSNRMTNMESSVEYRRQRSHEHANHIAKVEAAQLVQAKELASLKESAATQDAVNAAVSKVIGRREEDDRERRQESNANRRIAIGSLVTAAVALLGYVLQAFGIIG